MHQSLARRVILAVILMAARLAVAEHTPLTATAFLEGESVPLADGVVVERSGRTAYAVAPGGGVMAMDGRTGAIRWRNRDTDAPLLVRSGRVLCVLPWNQGADLQLRWLDAKSGKPVGDPIRITTTVSGSVTFGRGMGTRFEIEAREHDGVIAVRWEYGRWHVGGAVRREPWPVYRWGGRFNLDPATGNVGDPSGEFPWAWPAFQSLSGSGYQRGPWRLGGRVITLTQSAGGAPTLPHDVLRIEVPGVSTTELVIAEGEPHVAEAIPSADLATVRVIRVTGPQEQQERFRWTVFDASTAKRLHGFITGDLYGPFMVAGVRLLWASQTELSSVDLKTGQPVWRRKIRSLEYHGPTPP